CRDEARHEPPYGPARTRRLHRPRRLRRHPACPSHRPRRPQISRLPPPEKIRSCRLARPQIRARFLHLREMSVRPAADVRRIALLRSFTWSVANTRRKYYLLFLRLQRILTPVSFQQVSNDRPPHPRANL